MSCGQTGDVEIIFSRGLGEMTIQRWDSKSLKITDSLSAKGVTATFNAAIRMDEVMPVVESLVLIRQISPSGFDHIFTGRYEEEAIDIKLGFWNYSFKINSLIDFTHRELIEDYNEKTTLSGHILKAISMAEASGLLQLQAIAGESGEQFNFQFTLGNLEAFIDSLLQIKPGRWQITPIPFTDFDAKGSGPYGYIQIILDGVTDNKAVPYKFDPGTDHCGATDAADYLKFLGQYKEERKQPVASRWLVNGRNGRKKPPDPDAAP